MESLPLAVVKNSFSQVVERVRRTHERVTVTRNGRAAVVLLAVEDLAALEETIAVLSDEESLQRLARGRAAVASGDVMDEETFRSRHADLLDND